MPSVHMCVCVTSCTVSGRMVMFIACYALFKCILLLGQILLALPVSLTSKEFFTGYKAVFCCQATLETSHYNVIFVT